MASFAKLDENNIVINCVVVSDSDTQDADGNEVEAIGVAFLQNTSGGVWKRYSRNTVGNKHLEGRTPFRKNGAGIGRTYDEARDAFISAKLFDSWILNEETCQWEAPVAYPDGGKPFQYSWNEDTISWDLISVPKPFDSWTLNEDTCQWEPPTAYPDDGKQYTWNEETTTWVER